MLLRTNNDGRFRRGQWRVGKLSAEGNFAERLSIVKLALELPLTVSEGTILWCHYPALRAPPSRY